MKIHLQGCFNMNQRYRWAACC